jgi:hypothetical protein
MTPLSQLVMMAYDRYADARKLPLADLQLFAMALSAVLREEEQRQERDLAVVG